MDQEASIRVSSQIRRRIIQGQAVYEKQYTTDQWSGTAEVIRKRAEREYDVLRCMSESGRFRRRLGLVRVASCDPGQARIVTHEVPGHSLAQWLRDPEAPRHSLRPWFVAGAWLRQFQSLPLPSSALVSLSDRDPPDLVAYCELRLESLRQLGYRWPGVTVRQAMLDALERLKRGQEDWATRRVWVHADYAPGNLIWDGATLTPIDFATVRSGGPLDDATYLIHRLEMQLIYRPWLRWPLNAYRRAILRGLGQPNASSSATYQALMLRHLLCRLHTYVWRPPGSTRQAVHNRWVRAAIRRRIVRMI